MDTTERALQESLGKNITGLSVRDNVCTITFPEHTLVITDEGQSCCEDRYMVCDDNLAAFLGAELLDVTIADAPRRETDDEVHEVQFLHVKTTQGSFTISNHNEHNGYYGGFHVVMRCSRKVK